jgi:phosphopantothenoylcysteine decarboxylase/phosphopantothenate--cysteine ligase
MPSSKNILLIITGSIAAYKSLELIRRLRELGHKVTCVLTKGGAEFVTPLSVAALSEQKVYSELFDLKDETEMGHIRLSREADVVLVVPASADILAKMAHGLADDLATTLLLATSAPVFVAPAMNVKMWEHAATKRNIATIKKDGITIIQPTSGKLACGEEGAGRMAEIEIIVAAISKISGAKK